jgi:thiol-disulfide isomerase/thioredoxin
MKKRVMTMPNEKQTGSAAQRREQERQQRQQREDLHFSTRSNKAPIKAPRASKKDRSGLYLVLGALLVVGTLIAGIMVYNNMHQPSANLNLQRTAADPTALQMLTGVSQSTWETVGTGGVKNPFKTNQGQPLLKGPHGQPQVFYVGAEFCPYCAAERWAMINALSRFGTFSHVSQLQSAEYMIPTFSFYKSSYSSQYVDFMPVEVNGNALDKSGQSYVTLETLTADQQKIFSKYDSTQNFPFVDVGNQYTAVGASYDPALLLDSSSNPLTWQDIASSLSNTNSPTSKAILGTANYMTAALCNLTNQQPGKVCNSSSIQQIEHTLGKTSSVTSTKFLTPLSVDLIAEQKRIRS